MTDYSAHVITVTLGDPEIIILTDVDPRHPAEVQEVERFPYTVSPEVSLREHGYQVTSGYQVQAGYYIYAVSK